MLSGIRNRKFRIVSIILPRFINFKKKTNLLLYPIRVRRAGSRHVSLHILCLDRSKVSICHETLSARINCCIFLSARFKFEFFFLYCFLKMHVVIAMHYRCLHNNETKPLSKFLLKTRRTYSIFILRAYIMILAPILKPVP